MKTKEKGNKNIQQRGNTLRIGMHNYESGIYTMFKLWSWSLSQHNAVKMDQIDIIKVVVSSHRCSFIFVQDKRKYVVEYY